MAKTGGSRPNRVSFEAADDVLSLLPPARPRGPRQHYLNEAVRHYAQPPVSVKLADSNDEACAQIRAFLDAATRDVLLVGMSLEFIMQSCHDVLEQHVRRGVTVTAMLLPESAPKNSILGRMLSLRLGDAALLEGLLLQVRGSTERLAALRAVGREHNTNVEIRTCAEVPMVGLIVRDRSTPNPVMRTHVYSSLSLHHRQPVLEIDPGIAGGKQAYTAFNQYYEELLSRSRPLPDARRW